MEARRPSASSRSSCETASGLRHAGGSGLPTILCSGITRPSSRTKSRHTNPHLTSFSTPELKPPNDWKVTMSPPSGGHSAPVVCCFTVRIIDSHLVGSCLNYGLVMLFLNGFATDDLRSFRGRFGPGAARQYPIDRLLHHAKEGAVAGIDRRRQGQVQRTQLWGRLKRRDGFGLLYQISNPQNGDRVIADALEQAYVFQHDVRRIVPVRHHDADQDQFNARKDAETERNPECLLPPRVLDKAAKHHQEQEKAALHEANTAVKREHCRDDTIYAFSLAGERIDNGQQQQQAAGPAKNDGPEVLNAAVLLKEMVNNLIHDRHRQQHAQGVAGPVGFEIATLGIAVDDEEDGGLHHLEQHVGEKSREDRV